MKRSLFNKSKLKALYTAHEFRTFIAQGYVADTRITDVEKCVRNIAETALLM